MGHMKVSCDTSHPQWNALQPTCEDSRGLAQVRLQCTPNLMELSEVLRDLRKLNQPVPKPFRLPTEDEVRLAEEVAWSNFHEDYRRFLLATDVKGEGKWS